MRSTPITWPLTDTLVAQQLWADPNQMLVLGFSYYEAHREELRTMLDGAIPTRGSLGDGTYFAARPRLRVCGPEPHPQPGGHVAGVELSNEAGIIAVIRGATSMSIRVRVTVIAATAVLAFVCAPSANAQSETSSAPREGTVPIATLIEAAAKRTGKTFIVDPRVQGEAVLIGADPAKLDYAGLLSVLQVHGFAVVERGNVLRVIPDANVRQQPVPLVAGKESHPDAEFVTRMFTVKNVPAAQLVPILRPLLPQVGHLVAFPCTNMLMIVDTFGNVQRIEKLVQSLDVGGPFTPPKCDGEMKPSR